MTSRARVAVHGPTMTTMERAPLYYTPSGKVPTAGAIKLFAVGVPVMAAIGLAYGVASSYLSFHFLLGALCLFGGVVAVATAAGLLLQWGRVRNRGFNVAATVLLSLVALYGNWIGFLWAYSGWGFFLVSPVAIADAMGVVLRETGGGWLSIVLWIVEAAALTLVPVLLSHEIDKPYCEVANAWTAEETDVARLVLREDLRRALEAGDFDALVHAAPADFSNSEAIPPVFMALDVYRSPRDDGEHFVTVNRCVLKVDDEAKVEVEKTPLVRFLRVPRDVLERLPQTDDEPFQAALEKFTLYNS